MEILPDKSKEFTVLFEEFINSYPNTSKGIKHISSYSQQRESGRRNYQAILEAKEAGEDITDRVLLQLLPYRDTKKNREQGAWIHIGPVGLNNHIKAWFEKLRWTKSEDWQEVANLIFNFINSSVEETETLSMNCQDFDRSTYSKGLQTGYMTPILNALNPDCFILINNKLGVVIDHFADTNFSHKLIDYPAINKRARQLIKDLSSTIDRFDLPALRQDDIFDMFCHWLVADKKYNFKSGLVEGDHTVADSTNLINKSNLEESKIEEEKLMTEIHPDSYFSDETIPTLRLVDDDRQTIYNFKYKINVEYPFIKLCHEIIENLSSYIPSNIKGQLNLIDTVFIKNYDGVIKCETEYTLFITYFDNLITFKLDFELNLDNFSSNYYVLTDKQNIGDNSLLIKEWDIIKPKHNSSEIPIEYLEEKTNNYIKSKIQNINFTNLLELYPYIKFSAHNNNSWMELNLYTILYIEEIFNRSSIAIVDNIIEAFNHFYLVVLVLFSENPEKEIEEHLKIWNPKYKLEKYVDATYIEESQLNTWIKSITRKKQAIFYGSPGTGKTFIAENIAQYLIGGGDGFYELIQFHPAYSYEDFIQGIRPQTKDSGQLSYNLVPGQFLEFCRQAAECKDKCVLIIDEINRANLAEVFGELMYLLEYREQEICLAGSQEKFKIPDNVYLIGTMNTADRSIALVDFALRRRFAFIKIAPNYDIITKFHQQHTKLEVTGLITVLQEINNLIEDENYYLGVSFFLTETLTEDLEDIWQMEIEPYLEEYFYDRLEEIKDYQWENIKDRIAIDKDISKE